jgi:hypothetical protein
MSKPIEQAVAQTSELRCFAIVLREKGSSSQNGINRLNNKKNPTLSANVANPRVNEISATTTHFVTPELPSSRATLHE